MNHLSFLKETIFSPNSNPKKLIFLLHGYGDNATNFIQIASLLNIPECEINFIALNAPKSVSNFPLGFEWFNIYPNGIYISDLGPNEKKIIQSEILVSTKKIINSIIKIKDKYNLDFSDCFVFGFSQGGIMTFELGQYLKKQFAGLAIISGRILENDNHNNSYFIDSPLFISHGDKDDILPIKNFYNSCDFLKKNKFNFEDHLLRGDTHTISHEAIDLLQKFVKKNL